MSTHFGFEPTNAEQYFFLSYNTEDSSRIAPIACALHDQNVPIWYDRGLKAGSATWEQQIAEKIDACQAMIMFITKGILKKQTDSFVYKEYNLAKLFSKKKIYILLLDQIKLEEVPISMRVWWLDLLSNQCIHLHDEPDLDSQAKEIIRNLRFHFRLTLPVEPPTDYSVDIVHCICTSAEMAPVLGNVKKAVLAFNEHLPSAFRKRNRSISQLRCRIISFRNYLDDEDYAMLVTDFFDLRTQKKDFSACVRSMDVGAAESVGSNALEALAYALSSPWNNNHTQQRQIVVLWTNTLTVPMGLYVQESTYPQGMPNTTQHLKEWWGDRIHQDGKRLILFAPDNEGDFLNSLNQWDKVFRNSIALTEDPDNLSTVLERLSAAILT